MARRKSNRSRRNPVRKQGSQWAVIKPDGTVDLLLGDEKVARRLAAACGYDAAPAAPTRRKPAARKKRAMQETAKTPSFYSTEAAPYSGDKRYRVYDTGGFEVDSRKEAPKLLKIVESDFARMNQAMVDSANHYMMTGDTLSVFRPGSEFNHVYEESRLSIPKIKILIKRGTPSSLRDAVSRLQDLGKFMIPVLNAGEVQLASHVSKPAGTRRAAAPAAPTRRTATSSSARGQVRGQVRGFRPANPDHIDEGLRLLAAAKENLSKLDQAIDKIDERMTQYNYDFPPIWGGKDSFEYINEVRNEGRKVVFAAGRQLAEGEENSVETAIEALEKYHYDSGWFFIRKVSWILKKMDMKHPPRPKGRKGKSARKQTTASMETAKYGYGMGMTKADARRNPTRYPSRTRSERQRARELARRSDV